MARRKRETLGQEQFDLGPVPGRIAVTPGDGVVDPAQTPMVLSKPGRWVSMNSSRVAEARYDRGLNQVQVVFSDGTPWVYDTVPPEVWAQFRRAASPGKFINRVLNGYPYGRGSFDRSSAPTLFDS